MGRPGAQPAHLQDPLFFGVLRFGLVRWDGVRMLPYHDPEAGNVVEETCST